MFDEVLWWIGLIVCAFWRSDRSCTHGLAHWERMDGCQQEVERNFQSREGYCELPQQ